MISRRLLLLVTTLTAALDAAATQRGSIIVVDAWSRSTPPGARAGVIYMTIRNDGARSDRVQAIETPAAARAELHRTVVDDGVARMMEAPSLEIPARGEVKLEPNGLHVMLIDLRGPLVEGATLRLTIRLASGVSHTLDVPVRRSRPSGHSTH